MFVARLVCSHAACTEVLEARAVTLAELETLACDCGCALQVLGFPDTAEDRDAMLEVEPVGAGPV